jgi:hypothetical protein
MNRINTAIQGIHIPTFVTVFIVSLLTQFAITQNGVPIDISTNEGRANVVVAIILLLAKTVQTVPSKA